MDDYGENVLSQNISRVEGLGLVTIGGQQQPATRLEMGLVKLANIGLIISSVRTAVLNGTSIPSKGVLQGQAKSLPLQANNQLMDTDGYDQIVLAWRDGAPCCCATWATPRSARANLLLAGWFGNERAVLLNVLLTPGANAIAVVDKIKAEPPRLQAALLKAMKVSVVSDRTQTIRASVSDVENTLMLTVGLVVLNDQARVRVAGGALRPWPVGRAAPSGAGYAGHAGDHHPGRRAVRDHPQGLLPRVGHRPRHRDHRSGAGRLDRGAAQRQLRAGLLGQEPRRAAIRGGLRRLRPLRAGRGVAQHG